MVPGDSRPHVVLHVAVSLDGATTGFDPDVAAFYGLVSTWDEDATLTGADTILAQQEVLAAADGPGPDPSGPLLVVVDSRHRVTAWEALRAAGHWSDVVAARSERGVSPDPTTLEIRTAGERVDLPELLRVLHRDHGVDIVRVDSGGKLAGALLDADLVDEISLLVHPCLVPADAKRWFGTHRTKGVAASSAVEHLADDLVWLRYRMTAEEAGS